MNSKDYLRRLLEKQISRFVPNPGWTENMGINWFKGQLEKMTELDCYNLLNEAYEELRAWKNDTS